MAPERVHTVCAGSIMHSGSGPGALSAQHLTWRTQPVLASSAPCVACDTIGGKARPPRPPAKHLQWHTGEVVAQWVQPDIFHRDELMVAGGLPSAPGAATADVDSVGGLVASATVALQLDKCLNQHRTKSVPCQPILRHLECRLGHSWVGSWLPRLYFLGYLSMHLPFIAQEPSHPYMYLLKSIIGEWA